MVFPTSKLSVGGKSLSDITKDELKAALAQHCAPGFAPMDGISTVLGRWETIGVHCGKPPARDGSSELMLSLDLYRPRPVAQRKDERGDELASPQKRWPEVKGRPRMASRYDEPAAVLIYTATQDAEAVLSKLVQER